MSDDEGSDYGESISNIEVSEDDDEDYNPTTTAAHTFDKCRENSQALFSFLFSIFCFLFPCIFACDPPLRAGLSRAE